MKTPFREKLENFNNSYGTLTLWIGRLLFYPLAIVVGYAGTAYLKVNYVTKPHFDKAMTTLADDKGKYAAEVKQELKEINGKLDSLLQSNAANSEKFSDHERRLTRLENKADSHGN